MSLFCRLKNLVHKGVLKEKDLERIVIIPKEQEPCEDYISRQATVERLCKVAEFMNEKRNGLGSPYVMAALFIQDNKDEFPSVTPKPKTEWIPVSERMPEDGQSVLFCDIDDDIMVGYHVKGRSDTHFSQDGTYEDMKNVRAWMPLPEPYKTESEDKE